MKHRIVIALFLFCSCSLPQWRVFQKTVPTNLSEPSPEQKESQRRAGALIVDLSAEPTADPVKRIADIHAVAVPLSASLGEPLKRATVFELPKVITDTRAGVLDQQRQLEAWRVYGKKYGGMKLEGTGVNLAGPAGLLGLVAVVAACVACPAIGYALLRVLPLLWGAFRRMTSAVNWLAESNPAAADDLKAKLSVKMDEGHKRLVKLWAKKARPAAASA